ncbi:MAG: hypothetical protein QME66_07900 [Candidatus Eisenbacteria bacterium]|nr:hypothetical protein [Candidatus Eisenbacteria bacterium]
MIRNMGMLLLFLGGASGVVLFVRAVVAHDKISEGPGIGTLWGLFILCTTAGIIIVASTG